eukprot:CAMPEP_0170507658 /NCGR_PEP_ID=MMETSP0208-20121228/59623_1 /TAXON_ID=197538 /ORGANISM="Strombidium inclinatum, Strain S3" /LENGTH=34 /DNA_ID= /DNA_START= /DNA_END= /DNA_ORIENTATION=
MGFDARFNVKIKPTGDPEFDRAISNNSIGTLGIP